MTRLKAFLYLISSILILNGCSDEKIVDPGNFQRGEIIDVLELQTFTSRRLQSYLSQIDIPDSIELNYDVTALSIEYASVDAGGSEIKVSGGLLIPHTSAASPLLSIQHGTETHRYQVASVSPLFSVEGAVGLMAASNGYVSCVPDYPGFGVSRELHPYVHAKSLALNIIDFLRAAKNYCRENGVALNEQLFIGGYSEGGYATMSVQREIERNYSNEFTITASAPMAGPYDLWQTTQIILGQTLYGSPAYIAFILTAYNDIYRWDRLNDIFREPYAAMVTDLFDGSRSYGEINNALPSDVGELLKDEFIENVLAETDTEVVIALKENTLLDWTPQSPMRLFHGDNDSTVPYVNATTALQVFSESGADVGLVTIPGGDHASSGLPAVLGMIGWMNSLRN